MKKQKSLFLLFMALVMMALSPQSVWAWGGSGTSSSPYTIANAADLVKFANIVNGTNGETRNVAAWGKLTADIDLNNAAWKAMGSSSYAYTGTFDGQGHTISGFSILNYTAVNSGFFGYVNNATIKNFTLNGTMTSATQITNGENDCSGAVVGRAMGSSTIQDIVSNVSITLTKAQKHLGGVVGAIEGSTVVKGCTYTGTLDAGPSSDCIGGIVGFAPASCSGSISYCFFNGTLSSSSSAPTMGGILGYTNDESNNFGGVRNCYSCGTFSFGASDYKYVNAIVGRIRNRATTTISNTYLSGIATRACNTDGPSIPASNKAITISVKTGSNKGTVSQNIIYPTSTAPTNLHVEATVTAAHYHFANWSDGSLSSSRDFDLCRGDNIDITANFAIDRFTIKAITTDDRRGDVTGSGTYDYGTQATITAIPTADYKFTSWSDGNTDNPRVITVTENKNLTAYFDIKSFTVTFSSNNESYGTVNNRGGQYAIKSTASCTAQPKSNHYFVQWSDGNTNASRTITVTGNATYTAEFAPNQYTITVNVASDQGGMGTVSGGGTFDYNSSKTITATPKSGYHFVQWSDGNTNASRTITVTGHKTYTAFFASNQCVIMVQANNNDYGTVTGGGTFAYKSSQTITATPNEFYRFVQWSDGNTENPRQITVMEDASYVATFVYNQHTITAQPNNPSYGTVAGGGTFGYGTTQTITATPNEHSHFVQWNDGNTNASRTITVTEDKTYTATFAIDQHTITVNTSNSDFGTVSGDGTFDYGATTTIRATPKAHYHFVRWNDGNINASRQITVTEDKTYTAEFAIDKFTISALANNNDFGTVSGGGTYDYNTIVALIAEPNEHYHFVRWNDGVVASTKYVTATSNSVYTATFAIDQHTIRVQTNNQNYGTVNGGGKYNYNSTQTITATPVPGGRFIKWDDEDTSNPRQIIVEGDATYTAIFDTPKEAKAVLENNTLTFYYDNIQHSGTTYGVGDTGTPGWIRSGLRSNIFHVVFDESFAVVRPTSMENWFIGCDKLTDITGWEYLNTEEVTNMSFVFFGCSVLSSIDLSHFSTEKVTNMSYMFHCCSSLASLDLSNFNTENVTDMSYMFNGCSSLASLDLSNFNTENVTDMLYMFASCSSLTSLDLSSFNTKNVTRMNYMFNRCGSSQALTLIIGNFDMRNVTEKKYMFSNNGYLNTLTMKSLPFLQEGTFDTQFSGDGKTVNYALELNDNSIVYDGTNYLPSATSVLTSTYTREMSNAWGTVVVPFEIVYNSNNGNYKLYYFESVDGEDVYFREYTNGTTIDAGTPMAVQAVDERNGAGKYEIVLEGNGTINTNITAYGNMDGTYTALSNRTRIYFIAQNQFWWAEDPITIAPFRAWFEIYDNPDTGDPDAAPARLRIVEVSNNEQVATWLDAINATDAKATKVMIDGQIFILKNGQMFDICGRKIK